MKDYDAPPPAGQFDHLATKRPGTVTAALVIIGIGAVFGVIIALVLLVALAAVPVGAPATVQAQLLAGVLLATGLVNGVALFFIGRGYGLARIIVLVSGGIGIVIDLISASPTFGDALYILAIVLLFLPASNLFFSAQATVRAAKRKS